MTPTLINVKYKELYCNVTPMDEPINEKKSRDIFWISMTMYSMQMSMVQRLKNA